MAKLESCHVPSMLSGTRKNKSYFFKKKIILKFKFNKIELPKYKDNEKKVSILFIIGFIIGDGTLYLRLRNSDKGSIWYISTLFCRSL